MITEYVTVWQRHYGGADHREVHYEDDSPDLSQLILGCQRTVEAHGGVIHLYEINNDGTLHRINTFGTF
jgi:hypothetical protein